jgi:hypothetical protein
LPFKEKEKESEGKSKAWWPMEEERKGSLLSGQWKEKEKVFSYLFPLSPQATSLKLSFLSFDIKVLLYHGPRPLFMHALPFPWPINHDRIS